MTTKIHKYHILTFGCQMNKNDSERLGAILSSMGMESTDDLEHADVILMNSCSVRESAEGRIYGKSRVFAELKKKKPHVIVGVTGCMPGRDKDGALERGLHDVDLYFPTRDMIMLPKWLSELNPDLRPVDLQDDYLTIQPQHDQVYQAYVTIQTGCNHFCTYCVVPHARGLEGNRSLKSIIDEVKDLASKGCVEITLLGQIVNHWIASDAEYFSKHNPYQKNDFAKLLWELNQIEGIERIHWTAPHPVYMDDEVIDALTLPKQINFLHLPVQSGNTEILKKMNRRHTREDYLAVIKKIRAIRPDIALATDIIVGFCGETDEQFQDTVSLYKECDFDISYNAQYSQRSGTVAAQAFDDGVPKEVKRDRWWVMQHLMEDTVLRKNEYYQGKTVSVMVDSYRHGMCGGNSSEMKRVNFPGAEDLVGQIVDVRIDKPDMWILWGKMV